MEVSRFDAPPTGNRSRGRFATGFAIGLPVVCHVTATALPLDGGQPGAGGHAQDPKDLPRSVPLPVEEGPASLLSLAVLWRGEPRPTCSKESVMGSRTLLVLERTNLCWQPVPKCYRVADHGEELSETRRRSQANPRRGKETKVLEECMINMCSVATWVWGVGSPQKHSEAKR